MKEIKKVKKEVKIEKYYCDICKEPTWGCINEISYESEDNYNYGSDGGYYKKYIYDICDDCMKNIIFTFIQKKIKEEPRIEEKTW